MRFVHFIQSYFNPLPRKEGDTSGSGRVQVGCYFNPLPRKEGDVRGVGMALWMETISIHSLVKRETKKFRTVLCGRAISIHSLVKRETIAQNRKVKRIGISIHSLVKRETLQAAKSYIAREDFNPLPRKEGDDGHALRQGGRTISIHSLVKRETDIRQPMPPVICDFNPLPRKEGDSRCTVSLASWMQFQSTPS